MEMHQDWRSKIEHTLRTRSRARVPGDYIQRNLDYFGRLLPRLRLEQEVVMHRRDISALTGGEWSTSSIGKFLQHLVKAGVVVVRNAGSLGLGITLKHNLTESPWRSRRSGAERVDVHEEEVARVEVGSPLQEDVEFDPMPTTPQPVRQFNVPENDDYCTSLDLDRTLAALDVVSQGLLRIDLSFAKDFSGQQAATLYRTQEALTLAVSQLSRIRSAIGAGDDSDLEEIVGSAD